MNKKHIIAAALALSLSMATANTQAAEASADLGANINQLIAEINVGTADWNKVVTRIDKLVARIDEQILEGTGDFDELNDSRRRLMNARAKIVEQHLTGTHTGKNGEVLIGENGEVLTGENGEVLTGSVNGDHGLGTTTGHFGGSTDGISSFNSGGTISGGGGGGGGAGGGLGGLGSLIGVVATFAVVDNNDSFSGGGGIIASEINP